jgi:ectoine hydroxylase-related dioxygenase (phytanoyl-CoA dioxygenase family)
MVIDAHRRLDRMRDEIIRLGLERNVLELELYGYTVVEDVMPLAFFDELRETILELGEEDMKAGRRIPLAGPEGKSYLVTWLLARGRIFEQAVMAEKPLALITYLMGESCQISSNHGHVRMQGDPPQGMHTDAPMVPDPIPENPVASNMMWVTDEFSLASGATLVVPGSHKRHVHPLPNAIKMALPLVAMKGSVAVFNGNLWHSAGARTIPGERVGMTVYFNRMYARPQEDLNAVISDEVVARNPPRFAHLIGRDNPYPARDFGFFNPRGGQYFPRTMDPRG